MHMADALVAPAVAATMYVCSGGAAGFSVKKVRLESVKTNTEKKKTFTAWKTECSE